MTPRLRHIMILTGEPSGDFHAGPLIRSLKELDPKIRITGIGGPAMRAQGAKLFFPIEKLSAMGLIQVIKQFSEIKSAFKAFKHQLKTDRPDLVVFIDYPGFNLRAAAYLKSLYPIPTLYYIAPKVWAWNAARLNKIKNCMDHVALILPFEPPIYRRRNIPATYVGNPLMDEYPHPPVTALDRDSRDSDPGRDAPVIGLLPGSRASEVKGLLPVMLKSIALIRNSYPKADVLISAASSQREDQINEILASHPAEPNCRLVRGRPMPIFKSAHMLIAASGTVTLEAALCQLPTILIYKVSPLTFEVGKILVKIRRFGLANLIAGREVMPELIQDDASPEKIAETAFDMLENPRPHIRRLGEVRLRLGGPGAPRRTARIALDLLNKKGRAAIPISVNPEDLTNRFDKPG